MKTIQEPIKAVRTLAGTQRYDPKQIYRKTVFCMQCDCPEGMLLYHSMTGELLLMEGGESPEMADLREAMVKHWFLVPQGFDEIKHCDQIKKVATLLKQESKSIRQFIVFTTTDCNARCFYCFEHGRRRYSMTEQTAYDVSNYMLDRTNGGKISIRWFGGEPLYNAKAIDIISETLRDHSATFEATMVSNAYLFDDEIIARAKELWHLLHVQVTIDGTEEVYNRTKAFISPVGSPYRRVLKNIRALLEAGIGVTVRLNMDAANASDLLDLADELGREFSAYPRFDASVALLIEYAGKIHAFESAQQALDMLRALNRKLDTYGIREKKQLRRELLLHNCMADGRQSTSILPDGRLGRCEYYCDSEEVGSIYGAWDEAKAAAWKQLKPAEAVCVACVHYPLCMRLVKCNSASGRCDELACGQRDLELLTRMMNTYENWNTNGEQHETDM